MHELKNMEKGEIVGFHLTVTKLAVQTVLLATCVWTSADVPTLCVSVVCCTKRSSIPAVFWP